MNIHLVILQIYSSVLFILLMLGAIQWSHASCPQGLTYLNIPSRMGKIGACVQSTQQQPIATPIHKDLSHSSSKHSNTNPTVLAQLQYHSAIKRISSEPSKDNHLVNRSDTVFKSPLEHTPTAIMDSTK